MSADGNNFDLSSVEEKMQKIFVCTKSVVQCCSLFHQEIRYTNIENISISSQSERGKNHLHDSIKFESSASSICLGHSPLCFEDVLGPVDERENRIQVIQEQDNRARQ